MCPSVRLRLRLLFPALLLVLLAGPGQAATLAERLEEIGQSSRFFPERALRELQQLEPAARLATPEIRGTYLSELGYAQLHLGQLASAHASAEKLIAFGERATQPSLTVKGLILKGNILAADNHLDEAHQLIWRAQGLAGSTGSPELGLHADIAAGQAHIEAGQFAQALPLLLRAAERARKLDLNRYRISALQVLSGLYEATHDYQRGLTALDEAMRVARDVGDHPRLAALHISEHGLAMAAGQPQRALAALQDALSWARAAGAHEVAAIASGNLADTFQRQGDNEAAVRYADLALAYAARIGNERIAAQARMTRGTAKLALGQVAGAKADMDRAIGFIEHSGDKPQLLADLDDYGAALASAGQAADALRVLQRARKLSEELYNEQKSRAVLELQQKYDVHQQQQKLTELQRNATIVRAELEYRRRVQLTWTVTGCFALVATVLLATLYRRLRGAHARLTASLEQLNQLSRRDPLTSLYNRRHFQQWVATEGTGAASGGRRELAGALFLLDIDHFKRINDAYGHGAGDKVLIVVANTLRDALRETDMIVRWGGEEFLAFVPQVQSHQVDRVAQRILDAIAGCVAEYNGRQVSVRVSIGYALLPLPSADNEPLPWERAVALADMALYLAKENGRNRAYGIRGIAAAASSDLDRIERDLHTAWREGLVDLSLVTGPTMAGSLQSCA